MEDKQPKPGPRARGPRVAGHLALMLAGQASGAASTPAALLDGPLPVPRHGLEHHGQDLPLFRMAEPGAEDLRHAGGEAKQIEARGLGLGRREGWVWGGHMSDFM